MKYLPGVTAHGVGPGQNNIYVRGLATAVSGIQGSGFMAAFPNVAVYLDEQSAQLPGRNLDVYAADLERIEILEGPQGTLFGAGAQAGVVRYITNKPKLDVTEANAERGLRNDRARRSEQQPRRHDQHSAHCRTLGRARRDLQRARAGDTSITYPATFARAPTDLGISLRQGGRSSSCQQCRRSTTSNIAGNAINPVTYQGVRARGAVSSSMRTGARCSPSLIRICEADGVFAEMAANSLGEPQPDSQRAAVQSLVRQGQVREYRADD